MANILDDGFLAPLDLSTRRNSNNNNNNNNDRTQGLTLNRPPNGSLPFPLAPFPQSIEAPPPTLFSSYSPREAKPQIFPREMNPVQFFNTENVLNLGPQPKPVPMRIDYWNRDSYSNSNPNQHHTAVANTENINGNNGLGFGLGYGLPWINLYMNYPNNCSNYTHLAPQIPPTALFPFQPIPTQSNSMLHNYNRYEYPHPSNNDQQPTSAFHPPQTYSSYSSWAQNNERLSLHRHIQECNRRVLEAQADFRYHTCVFRHNSSYADRGHAHPEQSQVRNEFARDAWNVDVTSLSSGSVHNDGDEGNHNDIGEHPPPLTPPLSIPGPSRNFEEQPDGESQDIDSGSGSVSLSSFMGPLQPKQNKNVSGDKTEIFQTRDDGEGAKATLTPTENAAVAVASGISSDVVVSRRGRGRPNKVTVEEPTAKICVLVFGSGIGKTENDTDYRPHQLNPQVSPCSSPNDEQPEPHDIESGTSDSLVLPLLRPNQNKDVTEGKSENAMMRDDGGDDGSVSKPKENVAHASAISSVVVYRRGRGRPPKLTVKEPTAKIRVFGLGVGKTKDDTDSRPPQLTPQCSPCPSTNFDEQNQNMESGISDSLIFPLLRPSQNKDVSEGKSKDVMMRDDSGDDRSVSKPKENIAGASGISNAAVSRRGRGRPAKVTVEEPPTPVKVFGLRVRKTKTDKPTVASKLGKVSGKSRGRKGMKSRGKEDPIASVTLPSTRATRGNKGPKAWHPKKAPSDHGQKQKSHGEGSVQSQRSMELNDAPSGVVRPKRAIKKPIKWLLIHPETGKSEINQ